MNFYNVEVEENQKTIEVMPHIKDIENKWYIGSSYHLVSEYLHLLPPRTKYTLSMGCFDLNKHPDLDKKLRMINWNDKRIYSIHWWEIQQLNILNIIR